jgi:serine/threonine protein kinase
MGEIDRFSPPSCDKTPYVVKLVSESILEHLQEFRAEFEGHPRLRVYVDKVEKENMLVYEYFKSDLLALVENYPPLPLTARKKILNEIGNTLAEMHEKNWIHLGTKLPTWPGFDTSFTNLSIDVKPDNIFLNWYVDASDEFRLERVVLGDMDCALKLKGEKLLNYKIGNVMWRSPEGQLGRGVGKPSEVFSFALLVGLVPITTCTSLLTAQSNVSTSSRGCSHCTSTLRSLTLSLRWWFCLNYFRPSARYRVSL